MSVEEVLEKRSGEVCELCASENKLGLFLVEPSDGSEDQSIYACELCREQLALADGLDVNHWRCLADSIWSSVPAVQVTAFRQLKKLGDQAWAQNILDMVYLEPEVQAWADKQEAENGDSGVVTKDSNGTTLSAGDTVTVIKDLDVKGASFVAKRGTTVKNISLTDNPEHIEGRVNGTRIVLKTCFLKKA